MPMELSALRPHETLDLLRSVYFDAPNLARFAESLHEHTGGSPLYILEICRNLLARGVIHYHGGLWTLPGDIPTLELPTELSETVTSQLSSLSRDARTLAECLSLLSDQPSLEMCTSLCREAAVPGMRARNLLDELIHAGVVQAETNGYGFRSSVVRRAILAGMNAEKRELNHRSVGQALVDGLGRNASLRARLEAGFHLIEGADPDRGADLIAGATHNLPAFIMSVANLERCGRAVEAAYKVYRMHRRSLYERLPLLTALVQCGYYEDRYFASQYGDDTLDVFEALTGMTHARAARRFVGRPLALMFGLSFAFVRFTLTPRAQRSCGFVELLRQFCTIVAVLAGVAALSLDTDRGAAIAKTLEPFAFLSQRLSPVAVYEFSQGLSQIGRENEVFAYNVFERLLRNVSSPDYYPWMQSAYRLFFVAGLHFARGSLASFRADGSSALESARALENTGIKLYAMIASLLRYLYHSARGEFAMAAGHRDQVELHAAHLGTVWQVETWETAALTMIHAVAIGEVVSATRMMHRHEELRREVPSLNLYSRLSRDALLLARKEVRFIHERSEAHAHYAPRSFIGWAATQSAIISAYNMIGDFETARKHGDRTLAHITEADRDYSVLFVPVDIQVAHADAGLGQTEAALSRLDNLLERFGRHQNPLLQGMLHEARAHICWHAKRMTDYQHSFDAMQFWYLSTGNAALIAKCERLASLDATLLRSPSRGGG